MRRVLFAAAVAALLLTASYMAVSIRFPLKYMEAVRENAELNGLPPELIFAVIRAESGFRPDAVSPKGAAGLMQITEATGMWMAGEMGLHGYSRGDAFVPEINVAVGSRYLAWLLDYYGGELPHALCAYNAGMGNVNKWLADERYSSNSPNGAKLERIPFPETEKYLERVTMNMRVYKFLLKIRGKNA